MFGFVVQGLKSDDCESSGLKIDFSQNKISVFLLLDIGSLEPIYNYIRPIFIMICRFRLNLDLPNQIIGIFFCECAWARILLKKKQYDQHKP